MRRDLFSAADFGIAGAGGPGARGVAVAGPGSGQAYTVSAVNALVREFLEGAFPPLWVAGEVSGWKRHTSGHCYFSLRDAEAQLRCVMFRSDAQRLPTDPDEGTEVRVLGTLTLYERRGDYQLVVRELEAEGAGGLWRLAFEKLRARLEAEGLLAPERKRSLPRSPATVAVVTSPVGAALHDILHVIERRAPWTRVVVSPAKVQGDGAAEDVARAIERVARHGGADVVIVARGGGSVEDLWAFNEEAVARAISECPIPVISGVGHEVDVTIADLVADARAPTPSAAAETAVPDGRALARHLADLGERMPAALRQLVAERRGELMLLRTGLVRAVREASRRKRERLLQAAGKLEALSPLAALRRGYAVPQADDGRVLRRAAEFEAGGRFRLRVVDGRVICRVDGVEEEADAKGRDD
ncbi:MAG TPA: exodeoxyribonuclease VII large subunit [Longimicrobiales bacterium]